MPKGRNELPIEQLPAWEWKARTASDSLKTHYLPWLLSIVSLRYLRGPRVIEIAKKVMLWDFIVACVLSKLRGYNQLVYSGFDMNGSIASPIINSCGEYRLQKTVYKEVWIVALVRDTIILNSRLYRHSWRIWKDWNWIQRESRLAD